MRDIKNSRVNCKKLCVIVGLMACIIFAVLMAQSGVSSKAKAETIDDTVIYEQNFDGEGQALPDGIVNLTPNNGTATVSGGRLKLLSTVDANGNAAKNLIVRLPLSQFTDLTDFTYEVQFTVKRTTDNKDNRYIGFMLRMQNLTAVPPDYYQLAVRYNPTIDSGIEFRSYKNNTWGSLTKGAYSGADLLANKLDGSKLYTAKIVVSASRAVSYLNGVKVTEANIAEGFEKGELGFQICNMEAEIASVKVTQNQPKVMFDGMVKQYKTTSPIIDAATVITNVQTLEQYNSIVTAAKQASARPATAILHLDNQLNVVVDSGVAATLNSTLSQWKMRVIPALHVSSIEAADKLLEFLQETALTDVCVMSKNPQIVKHLRTANAYIRAAIDYSDYNLPLDTAKLGAIRDEVNSNLAKIAYLPSTANFAALDYLQQRIITVWINSNSLEASLTHAVTLGANGIVTDDYNLAYTVTKKFSTNSRMRAPYIAAHRGNTIGDTTNNSVAAPPANSLEASVLAYEKGADVIESDIYITTDNQLVIGHDNTLGKNGELNADKTPITESQGLMLENMTLAQAKTYYLKGGEVRIPTLSEYLTQFKDKDVMHYIEIKSDNAKVVPTLKALIQQLDVSQQVVVILFYSRATQFVKMRELLPQISIGYLTQDNAFDKDESVRVESPQAVLADILPKNASYHPTFQKLNKNLVQELTARGVTVWTWTCNTGEQISTAFKNGYSGITTDQTTKLVNLVEHVSINAETLKVPASSSLDIVPDSAQVVQLQLKTKNTTELKKEKPSVLLVISGKAKLKLTTDGKLYGTVRSDGENTMIVAFGYTYTDENAITYTMFTSPITVQIGDDIITPPPVDPEPDQPTDQPTDKPVVPTPPKKGCKSDIGVGSMLAIILICGVIVLAKVKKSKKAI